MTRLRPSDFGGLARRSAQREGGRGYGRYGGFGRYASWSAEEKREVERLYAAHVPICLIADAVGRTPRAVRSYVIWRGCKRAPRRLAHVAPAGAPSNEGARRARDDLLAERRALYRAVWTPARVAACEGMLQIGMDNLSISQATGIPQRMISERFATWRPYSDRRCMGAGAEARRRACLMCGNAFQSKHIGERVCPSCKATDAWRSGADASTAYHRPPPRAAS